MATLAHHPTPTTTPDTTAATADAAAAAVDDTSTDDSIRGTAGNSIATTPAADAATTGRTLMPACD